MIIDIHCHLDKLDEIDYKDFIKENKIGAVSMDISGAKHLIDIKKNHPNEIELFLGIHPEVCYCDSDIDLMIELITENKDILSGIGEIGIPFFYLEDKTDKEKKNIKARGAATMERFIQVASSLDLPINTHIVEEDIHLALPILEKYNLKGALFHWYEGSQDNLNTLYQGGHFISVSPWLFVEEHYYNFVKMIPLSMLLVESDAPCEYCGKKGVPSMTEKVLEALSNIHSISLEELKSIIYSNTLRYLRK